MKKLDRHGHWPDRASAVAWIMLTTLGLGQSLQVAVVAWHHGGWAFLPPLLVALLLVALPLRLSESLLGRRAQRALLPGMAALTREADAPRFYRAWAWGTLLFSLLACALASMINAWSLTYLFHLAGSGGHFALDYNAAMMRWGILLSWVLSVGVGLTLSHHGVLRLPRALHTVAAAVLTMLVIAAAVQVAHTGFGDSAWPRIGRASTWWAALAVALPWGGGGVGLWYVAAVLMPTSVALPHLATRAFAWQGLLLLLAMLIVAPSAVLIADPRALLSFLMLDLPNALASGSVVVAILVYASLLLASWVAMVALLEPLRLELEERDWSVPGLMACLALAILVATALLILPWHLHRLLQALQWLLAIGLAIFVGWAMKISHARKALALPQESLYNAWRVTVRIIVPLALLTLAWQQWGGGF